VIFRPDLANYHKKRDDFPKTVVFLPFSRQMDLFRHKRAFVTLKAGRNPPNRRIFAKTHLILRIFGTFLQKITKPPVPQGRNRIFTELPALLSEISAENKGNTLHFVCIDPTHARVKFPKMLPETD